MNLSVIVLTKNENRNISDCLSGLNGADEVLVVDDFSEDNTVSLAEAAGARVVQHRLDTFADQRNFSLSQSRGDWVFYLDADERLSPDLMKAVRSHMADGRDGPGSVVRRNFAFGRRHRFGPLKPDRVTRLFRRDNVRWEGAVHERPVFAGEARPLDGHLLHMTYRTWDQYLAKQMRYAAIWADEAGACGGRRATVLTAVWRAWAGYLKMMLLNLGILGGPACWALCWYHGAYTLTKYLKLAEKNEGSAE